VSASPISQLISTVKCDRGMAFFRYGTPFRAARPIYSREELRVTIVNASPRDDDRLSEPVNAANQLMTFMTAGSALAVPDSRGLDSGKGASGKRLPELVTN